MKYLSVIDTNIIISSLLSKQKDSSVNKVMNYIKEEEIVPLYCDEILNEYKDVLNRKEFDFPSHVIGSILNFIKEVGVKIIPVKPNEILIDTKDQIFYDTCLTKRDNNSYLITGNLKHFPIRNFIVSAKDMIDIINHKLKLS